MTHLKFTDIQFYRHSQGWQHNKRFLNFALKVNLFCSLYSEVLVHEAKGKYCITLHQAMKTHRGCTGVSQLFNFGARWSTPRPGLITPGKETRPIVKKAGCAPGPVWTTAENFAIIRITSPKLPIRSESVYSTCLRFFLTLLIVIDGTDRLYRNVGTELPLYAT
jgi:hypothetical protein